MIRLGFEPKTHSLEGCCSIQLSYQTILLRLQRYGFFSKCGPVLRKNFKKRGLSLMCWRSVGMVRTLGLGLFGRLGGDGDLRTRLLYLQFVAHEYRFVSFDDGFISLGLIRHFNKSVTL